MNSDYDKYLKYKKKYLNFKSQLGGATLTDEEISEFCLYIFTYLKSKNNCFTNGAFVFEDPLHQLLFLFTFNTVYFNPRGKEPERKASIHWTTTHAGFLKNNRLSLTSHIKPGMASLTKFNPDIFKLERILSVPINYICDQETNDTERNPNNSETKRIILFYPFKNIETETEYLFVKFESHSMSSFSHAVNLLDKKRSTTYPIRRETDATEIELLIADRKFYINHYDNLKRDKPYKSDDEDEEEDEDKILNIEKMKRKDLKALQDYNDTIRTGNEFFVTYNLLKYLLQNFFISKGKRINLHRKRTLLTKEDDILFREIINDLLKKPSDDQRRAEEEDIKDIVNEEFKDDDDNEPLGIPIVKKPSDINEEQSVVEPLKKQKPRGWRNLFS
jgi:hypothetical protein